MTYDTFPGNTKIKVAGGPGPRRHSPGYSPVGSGYHPEPASPVSSSSCSTTPTIIG